MDEAKLLLGFPTSSCPNASQVYLNLTYKDARLLGYHPFEFSTTHLNFVALLLSVENIIKSNKNVLFLTAYVFR